MINKILILALSLVSNMILNAREISGTIHDSDNHPIEYASISIFQNDSIVAGNITDVNGKFSFPIPEIANKFRVSFVGYVDYTAPIIKSDVGTIIMHSDSVVLDEIVVSAPLIRREADRIILNIAANTLMANKNAQELLKTAPGVWTTDESLSIYGQEGTEVYINDNKVNLTGSQLINILRSVQSSSIATIEIIPKAGAEFNANSSGGVIRINLKKNRVDGISGSAGMNTIGGEYKAWFNPFANVSVHTGKWTINMSGNFNDSPKDKITTHEQSSNSSLGIELVGISKHKNKVLQGNAMLGVFYQASDNDRLGVQIDYSPDRSNDHSRSQTIMSGKELGETFGEYDNKYCFHNCNIALNWHHKLGSDGSELKWISNYNYQQTTNNEHNEMARSFVQTDSVYNTDNLNRYNIIATELSLNKVLPKDWRIFSGIKYTHNNMRYCSYHEYYVDRSWIHNDKYDYDDSFVENIYAAYITANGQTGRWRYKAGLRGELYQSSVEGAKINQFSVFPNVNVSYSLTDKGDYVMSLGYYRNARRPSFWALSPIIQQVSDYSYTVGNPTLKPSYSNSVSLDFILANRFTVAVGYTRASNAIRQMFKSDPEHLERMYLTWGNTGITHNGFIHGDGFIQLRNWWSIYASATYLIENQKMAEDAKPETNHYVQIVGSTTFRLPKGYNFTINCFYNSPMTIGNIKVFPIFNLNPTIQKSFGKHWSLSLGAENLLQRTGKIKTKSSGYERLTFTKNYATIRLGVTYTFNSGKAFQTPRIENNSDNSRLSKEQ